MYHHLKQVGVLWCERAPWSKMLVHLNRVPQTQKYKEVTHLHIGEVLTHLQDVHDVLQKSVVARLQGGKPLQKVDNVSGN